MKINQGLARIGYFTVSQRTDEPLTPDTYSPVNILTGVRMFNMEPMTANTDIQIGNVIFDRENENLGYSVSLEVMLPYDSFLLSALGFSSTEYNFSYNNQENIGLIYEFHTSAEPIKGVLYNVKFDKFSKSVNIYGDGDSVTPYYYTLNGIALPRPGDGLISYEGNEYNWFKSVHEPKEGVFAEYATGDSNKRNTVRTHKSNIKSIIGLS